MASIPLPALSVKPPEQPDVLGQYGNLLRLKGLQQEQVLRDQQQQLGAVQLQGAQQDLAARKALNDAYSQSVTKDASGNATFNPEKLQSSLATGPAAYKTPEVMEGITKFQQTRIDLQKSMADLQQKSADMIGGAAKAVKAAGYDPTLAHSLLDQLPPSPQLDAIRQKIDDPNAFRQMIDSAIANSPKQQQFQNEQTVAGIRANTPQMQKLNSWLAANPGKTAADYERYEKQLEVDAAVAKETNPQVMNAKANLARTEAVARQEAAQGDPAVAGEMLAKGDLTLTDLKSRGTTPQFITKAVAAAQKTNPNYNPADEVIAESVAKSQGANQFFGSANSLISKGGTLDQLDQLSKKIPDNKLPILNTVEDWQKLASGKGPLAGYAATALGVADDYGKVMGGGTASDHARDAALRLFGAAQSPEQRADAISATRDAVLSQRDSRIGNNQFLKRQYGTEVGGKIAVTDPRGTVHYFPNQKAADQFKQAAGIK